jgi:DNA-directed RNA polymerase
VLEQREYKQALKKVQQRNRELHSLRCDFVLKLKVAQTNKDEPALYFPHNVDFRGRAYTMHPHLNHLGADSCRGLLLFAQTRPLGDNGLGWLRIQVRAPSLIGMLIRLTLVRQIANLFGGGIDKKSLKEREQFAIDNMHNISDSVLHPLTGSKWWQQAEDPWQCLAACIELHDACQSSNPSTFESSLPVHQDGSCNGLQHYAALGRDAEGGRAVNLLPGNEPADVYTCAIIACLLLAQRISHAFLQGHREARHRVCVPRGARQRPAG